MEDGRKGEVVDLWGYVRRVHVMIMDISRITFFKAIDLQSTNMRKQS